MTNEQAVAEFARGLLTYVEDGSVVVVRECGFLQELQIAIQSGSLDEEYEGDYEDEDYWTNHKGGKEI